MAKDGEKEEEKAIIIIIGVTYAKVILIIMILTIMLSIIMILTIMILTIMILTIIFKSYK